MGVIDETTHTLTCKCGATESVKILQHGSAYSGSWQSGKPFARFKVTWGPSGPIGPKITSATCDTCGETPNIEVS